MAYLDYSPPELPDMGKAIAPLGDALTDVLNRRQKQQQFTADLGLKQEQEARRLKQEQDQFDTQQRAAERRDQQEFVKFQQSQAKYLEEQKRRAMEAPTEQERRRIVEGTVVLDPKTRQVQYGVYTPGKAADVGPEPQAPAEPAPPEVLARKRGMTYQPNQAEFVGPVTEESAQRSALDRYGKEHGVPGIDEGASVEGARAAGAHGIDVARKILAAREDRPQREADEAAYPGQIADFEQQKANFPAEHDAFEKKKARAAMDTPFTMQFGDRPAERVSPAESRYLAHTMDAQDFDHALPDAQLTPQEQRAKAATMAGLETGTLKKSDAAGYFQKMAAGLSSFDQKERLAAEHEAASTERTRMMANRPQVSAVLGGERLQDNRLKAAEERVDKISKSLGAPKDYESVKQLHDATANITSVNPAAQRGVAFQLARSYQGSGVLSNQDLQQIQGRIAGVGGSLESWLQKAQDGQLGESEQKVLFDAVQMQMRHYDARMQHNRDVAEHRMLGPDSTYRQHVSDAELQEMLDAAFPGTVSSAQPEPAHAPAEGGKPTVKVKAGGANDTDATKQLLDEVMKSLGIPGTDVPPKKKRRVVP